MEQSANLYIRVSTDEQADKGYSQRSQEEMLRKYCGLNNIEVRHVIYEDHSAKSFDRPRWKELLGNLRKRKNKVNLILFTKWDRFSRNAGDAYQMISTLRRLGAEPQAIEQPLDLSIPENKMMLAFYLAAPEVENDRRALNVIYGMRRAKREGRYMGLAPVGYINKSDENGKKYIAHDGANAEIMKWAFKEIARGIFNTEQIWKAAKEKGLKCSKNTFWDAIRNPLYCGKIFISAFKDEEEQFVQGLHQPIVSEALFQEVQDVLDGRGRNFRAKIITVNEFPLRGFLICPDCGRLLTGSRSKGRSRYYSYYHCKGKCKHRVSSDKVNENVRADLSRFIPNIESKTRFKAILTRLYLERADSDPIEKKEILDGIKDYESRLAHVRDLLATQQIDVSDYRQMKMDYGKKITSLELKLTKINGERRDIGYLVDKGLAKIIEIREAVKEGGLNEVGRDIGSIYPEKIVFEKGKVRTTRRNDFIKCISLINKELHENKNGTQADFSTLSRQVLTTGFEPVHP